LYDLNATPLIYNTHPGETVEAQIAVDGVMTGSLTYANLGMGWTPLNVPVQTNLAAGPHSITLQVADISLDGVMVDANSPYTNVIATGYQTINGQSAATGAQLSALSNGNVSINSSSPTTVATLNVVSSGGLYNLNATPLIDNTHAGETVIAEMAVDGVLTGNITYANLGTGWTPLNVPIQTNLAAGAHTITLQVADVSQNGVVVSENSPYMNIIATGYQTINGKSAATGAQLSSLSNGNLSVGTNTPVNIATLNVVSDGGLYNLDATPLIYNTHSGETVEAKIAIDGVATGNLLYVTLGSGWTTLDLPIQTNLAAGPHSITLQVADLSQDGVMVDANSPYTNIIATEFDDIASVPEPSTVASLILGAAGFLASRHRRKS
jgi:hypothetical protein